jgi:hypothetical protein
MHSADVCNVLCIRMRCAIYTNNELGAYKMNVKKILMELEEYTKYFDLCYWKERRQNPNSPDLNNWTARKRNQFQALWYGEKNGQH